MPIDWDEFDTEIDAIIDTSAAETDARLASRVSTITRMTNDEIQELFPKPAEVKKLTELMKIVKSSEDRNNKINRLVTNAEKFGGIVLSLLQKFS